MDKHVPLLILTVRTVGQGEEAGVKTPTWERQLSKCIATKQKQLNFNTLQTGMKITFPKYVLLL